LANLQAARELKIARKAALEAELKSLSAEIEANDKKIAELPGLIEKIQEEATSAMAEVNQCNAELTIRPCNICFCKFIFPFSLHVLNCNAE
jgi:peptidoglycan hydrolase CwlO-like protein